MKFLFKKYVYVFKINEQTCIKKTQKFRNLIVCDKFKIRIFKGTNVELKSLLASAHHLAEANESRRITQAEMAERIGVSGRAYAEYLRGREPVGMTAFAKLLSMLTDEQLVSVMRQFASGKANKRKKNDSSRKTES